MTARAACAALVALACCRGPDAATRPGGADVLLHPVTEADDGAAVDVPTGAALELRLAAHPGTAYAWAYAGPLPLCVEAEGPPRLLPAPDARPGGAQVWSHRLRVVAPGRCLVALEYRRLGDAPSAPPSRRFEVTLVGR